MTYQVNILNPKAKRLLQDLADLDLISIKKNKDANFLKAIERIRSKSKIKAPSLDEITKEVESVRAKRYAKKA